MLVQVVQNVLKGGRSIAVTLLHDPSPIGAICYRKCRILLSGVGNPDTIIAITDINLRPEVVCSNCVSNKGFTGDKYRLQPSFLISFD